MSVTIVKAVYGTVAEVVPGKSADVTDLVKGLGPIFEVKNKTMNGDPCRRARKTLYLTVKRDGVESIEEHGEGSTVTLG